MMDNVEERFVLKSLVTGFTSNAGQAKAVVVVTVDGEERTAEVTNGGQITAAFDAISKAVGWVPRVKGWQPKTNNAFGEEVRREQASVSVTLEETIKKIQATGTVEADDAVYASVQAYVMALNKLSARLSDRPACERPKEEVAA